MTYMPRVTTFGRNAVRMESRPGEFLDLDMIRAHAPTIFAEEAHESRSSKFTHIPTHEMLAALMKEGFMPTGVRVGGSKDKGKLAFTKHMIRLRRIDQKIAGNGIGSVFPEVVLKNGHDGTSAWHLMAGLFRMICMNGMVCPDTLVADVKVPHRGDAITKVIEGSYTVLGSSELVLDNAMSMSGVELTNDEARVFAEAALTLRFDEVPDDLKQNPLRVLKARRQEDRRPDLWSTFNRAQENLTKGGITFKQPREDEQGRESLINQSTRAIQSVDGDIKMNRALWVLAEGMRALKA